MGKREALILILLFSISFISAVWWNPFSWFEKDVQLNPADCTANNVGATRQDAGGTYTCSYDVGSGNYIWSRSTSGCVPSCNGQPVGASDGCGGVCTTLGEDPCGSPTNPNCGTPPESSCVPACNAAHVCVNGRCVDPSSSQLQSYFCDDSDGDGAVSATPSGDYINLEEIPDGCCRRGYGNPTDKYCNEFDCDPFKYQDPSYCSSITSPEQCTLATLSCAICSTYRATGFFLDLDSDGFWKQYSGCSPKYFFNHPSKNAMPTNDYTKSMDCDDGNPCISRPIKTTIACDNDNDGSITQEANIYYKSLNFPPYIFFSSIISPTTSDFSNIADKNTETYKKFYSVVDTPFILDTGNTGCYDAISLSSSYPCGYNSIEVSDDMINWATINFRDDFPNSCTAFFDDTTFRYIRFLPRLSSNTKVYESYIRPCVTPETLPENVKICSNVKTDCNDNALRISPNEVEVCDDQIDNNCNGRVDEGCSPCIDNDEDGYNGSMADGSNYDSSKCGPKDCHDGNKDLFLFEMFRGLAGECCEKNKIPIFPIMGEGDQNKVQGGLLATSTCCPKDTDITKLDYALGRIDNSNGRCDCSQNQIRLFAVNGEGSKDRIQGGLFATSTCCPKYTDITKLKYNEGGVYNDYESCSCSQNQIRLFPVNGEGGKDRIQGGLLATSTCCPKDTDITKLKYYHGRIDDFGGRCDCPPDQVRVFGKYLFAAGESDAQTICCSPNSHAASVKDSIRCATCEYELNPSSNIICEGDCSFCDKNNHIVEMSIKEVDAAGNCVLKTKENCENKICVEHVSDADKDIFASCEPCPDSLTFVTQNRDHLSGVSDNFELLDVDSRIFSKNTFFSFTTPEEVFSKISEVCKKITKNCRNKKIDIVFFNHGFPGEIYFGLNFKLNVNTLKTISNKNYDFRCVKHVIPAGCSVGKCDRSLEGQVFLKALQNFFSTQNNRVEVSAARDLILAGYYFKGSSTKSGILNLKKNGVFESYTPLYKESTLLGIKIKKVLRIPAETIYYLTNSSFNFPGISEFAYQTEVYNGSINLVNIYFKSNDSLDSVGVFHDNRFDMNDICSYSIVSSIDEYVDSNTANIEIEDFGIEFDNESIAAGESARIRINKLRMNCSKFEEANPSTPFISEEFYQLSKDMQTSGTIPYSLFKNIETKYQNNWQCIDNDECYGPCTIGIPNCQYNCSDHQCIAVENILSKAEIKNLSYLAPELSIISPTASNKIKAETNLDLKIVSTNKRHYDSNYNNGDGTFGNIVTTPISLSEVSAIISLPNKTINKVDLHSSDSITFSGKYLVPDLSGSFVVNFSVKTSEGVISSKKVVFVGVANTYRIKCSKVTYSASNTNYNTINSCQSENSKKPNFAYCKRAVTLFGSKYKAYFSNTNYYSYGCYSEKDFRLTCGSDKTLVQKDKC